LFWVWQWVTLLVVPFVNILINRSIFFAKNGLRSVFKPIDPVVQLVHDRRYLLYKVTEVLNAISSLFFIPNMTRLLHQTSKHWIIVLFQFLLLQDPDCLIDFPSKGLENHDPLVVDVLKKCLVRDPSKRASIEELLRHPYLQKTAPAKPADFAGSFLSADHSSRTEGGSNRSLADILTAVSSLTPNSRRMLVTQLDLKK